MTSTALLRSLLLTSLALVSTGCCEVFDLCAQEGAEVRDAGGGEDKAFGVITSENCGTASIESQNGGVCATCVSAAGDDVRVCGESDVAICQSREDAFGARCESCITDSGVTLYDDCVGAQAGAEARCESQGGPVPPDDSSPDVECAVCFDDVGNYVSDTCEPVSDECHDETDAADRACRVCTLNGVVVVRDCEAVDINPTHCELYENASGSCTDCYDGDTLLLHECSLSVDPSFVACDTFIDASGVQCSTCRDQNGVEIEAGCSPSAPEANQCQLLEFTSQTCAVCVDDFGTIASANCSSTCDATDPNCPPALPCEGFTPGTDGLCYTCFTDDALTATETRCLTEPNLSCAHIDVGSLPPDPNEPGGGQGDPAPPPNAVSSCLVCNDLQTGVEVFRDCAGGGTPVCAATENADGTVCDVCYDSLSGAPLYSSCDDGGTCYVTGDSVLSSANNVALTTETGEAAVATCTRCGSPGNDATLTDDDFVAYCSLPTDCADADGFVDPTVMCSTFSTLLIAPRACNNPWEAYAGQGDPESEMLGVLAWSLDSQTFDLVAAGALAASVDATCDGTCGECARGDVIQVMSASDDIGLVREALAGSLVGCGSDLDCPAGAACLQGACGY